MNKGKKERNGGKGWKGEKEGKEGGRKKGGEKGGGKGEEGVYICTEKIISKHQINKSYNAFYFNSIIIIPLRSFLIQLH